jgi:transmembrane sensor
MRKPSTDEQEAIDREASGWLVRIEENALDCDAQAEFQAWIVGDPRRERTYYEMRRTWAQLSELSDLTAPAGYAGHRRTPAPFRTLGWRTALVGGIGAAAAAVIAVVAIPGVRFVPEPHYTTSLAETRIVTLPDGSSVTLGAKSSMTLRFKAGERRVILAGGEAFFDVIHDPVRPFVVQAGESQVRDIGTKFDVNISKDTLRVSVLEGAVQVSEGPASTKRPIQLIRAGQETEVPSLADKAAAVAPAPILKQSAQPTAAWREGRFVFDNVRLADLAADVNRYYAPGVRLTSPDVENLRVTASFKTNEIPAFMSALNETLPVQAEQMSDGAFRISPVRR